MAKTARATRVKRPTSLDVAQLAGVSQTTVSFVLNGDESKGVSEETKARVWDAIAQLDYHPHEGARSMRSSATRMLGLVIPEAYNAHHMETAAGVEAYANRQGYSVFRAISNFQVAEERRAILLLKQRRFDALILSLGTGNTLYGEVQALREQGYIVTGLGFDAPGLDSVTIEPEVGERLALEHLIGLGHTRIGYIYGVASDPLFDMRLQTCLAVQRERGLPVVDAWIRHCGPTQADGYRATHELLAECAGGERPTALVIVNDLVASAVLPALFAAGVTVPTEMSVVSFDNTATCLYTWPPLTSVDCEAREMGEQAARLTFERLAEPQRPSQFIQTRASLVVRATTGPAPLR